MIKRMHKQAGIFFLMTLLLSVMIVRIIPAEEAEGAKVADSSQMAAPVEMDLDNLTPVGAELLKEGVYPVNVDSSSSMFQITECTLTVQDGEMTALMSMGGTGYLYLYMGTGEEASGKDASAYIPYEETPEGVYTFTIPVEALDQPIACAAFSKKKEMWYDRILVFRADSLDQDAFAEGYYTTAEDLNLSDGEYLAEVTLEGGSGRASIESPARIVVRDFQARATIVWGSSKYDYMKVGDEKFEPLDGLETSVFEIPVTGFDYKMPVAADTTAMSVPHEIEYTLYFDSSTLQKADAAEDAAAEEMTAEESATEASAAEDSVSETVAGDKKKP